MMPIFTFTAAFLCFSVWVIAENAASRRMVRLGLGCLTMIAMGIFADSLARYAPEMEISRTRNSLRLAEELMSAGDTQRVQQALHAYNGEAASGSGKASFELWYVLNHGPKSAEPAKR
jgi:hypothetical protein